MTMAIPFELFSPRECVAVLQTQLFEAGFSFLNLVPSWFRTRANKAHPDLVRSVVEKVLILLNIEIAELSQPIAQAATAQASTHVVLSRLEGGALDLDVELSKREAELLGRHYLRVPNVSGLQKSTSPRGLSVGEPGPKRIQHVHVLALTPLGNPEGGVFLRKGSPVATCYTPGEKGAHSPRHISLSTNE
ncbi:unnamed protein product [Phytophthora fragariaefolia]|uniref:Unnamed protein product n=1 Tax=Phytophthora fragariaefolia TaxID=1490495 RepID=A0A9W6Y851_9STRA|nr:unnamed protein product [Phytophthora fragariaefolia]